MADEHQQVPPVLTLRLCVGAQRRKARAAQLPPCAHSSILR